MIFTTAPRHQSPKAGEVIVFDVSALTGIPKRELRTYTRAETRRVSEENGFDGILANASGCQEFARWHSPENSYMREFNPNFRGSVGGAFVILLAILVDPPCGLDQLSAHEFADGHVERSLSFVVQDQKVFVEYAVGCNANTMKVLLNQWQTSSKSTSATESPALSTEVGSILPTATTTAETSASEPLTAADVEIEKAFQKAVLAEIARQLDVTCNGKRVDIRPVSVELSPRHHVNALARLEFDLPQADRIRLIAHDVLFPDKEGTVDMHSNPNSQPFCCGPTWHPFGPC